MDSIIEVIPQARDHASVNHVFVDLTYSDRAMSVEHVLGPGRVLDRVRGAR